MKPSHSQRNDPANPQPKAVSQQSPRLEPADCTATNSGTHAGENVPIAGDTGMHSAAQRNAIPEANVRKTVANDKDSQSQPCPRCDRGTVKRRTGDMWWQVQSYRCAWCRGTGRIKEQRVRYRTIVADPPWPMGPDHGARTKSAKGGWGPYIGQTATDLPYGTMTLSEIAALPVGEWAENDAHLYVWTVNKFIEETYDIVRAWGFRPSTLLTWAKAPMGIGLGWAHGLTTEHILFARRGNLPYIARTGTTWWQWRRGAHSVKPDAMLDMVESVSPGPYLELFARRDRLGWDTWGDESLQTAEVA